MTTEPTRPVSLLSVFEEGPTSIRVGKIARMASELGLSCQQAPRGRGSDYRPRHLGNGVSVWRESNATRVRRRLRRVALRDTTGALGIVDPVFTRVILDYRPTIIHWCGFQGALGAQRLAQQHGVGFLLDLQENYPYNMWSTVRDQGQSSTRDQLTDWLAYESQILTAADAILVTCPEMKSRLIGMHGISAERLFVVHNTEHPDDWQESSRRPPRGKGGPKLLFGGSCSAHRGIDTVIRGVAAIEDRPLRPLTIVAGGGPALQSWQALAHDLGVSEWFRFTGEVPWSTLKDWMEEVDFGLVPHHQYGQTDNTLPHKLYQHFGAGLPTIASSCHALESAVRETGAGVVFRAGDPQAFADLAISLATQSIDVGEMSHRARKALQSGPYSWRDSADALLRAVHRVTSSC